MTCFAGFSCCCFYKEYLEITQLQCFHKANTFISTLTNSALKRQFIEVDNTCFMGVHYTDPVEVHNNYSELTSNNGLAGPACVNEHAHNKST